MTGVSLVDHQQLVENLAEEIRKYGEARGTHQKSAESLAKLTEEFGRLALGLNEVTAGLKSSTAEVGLLNDAIGQMRAEHAKRLDSVMNSTLERFQQMETRLEALDLLESEAKKQESISNQILYCCYGGLILLVLLSLLTILR